MEYKQKLPESEEGWKSQIQAVFIMIYREREKVFI